MNRLMIVLFLFASVGCTPNGRPDRTPTESLVTRQSEPLVARPQRLAATRFEATPDIDAAIAEMLGAESSSSEVVVATGLAWSDGRKTVAVSHIHFPPHDMTESDFAAAVDDDALERCDTEFQDCVDGADSCKEEAYEACIRSGYRNTFVYKSSHLGIDCGVLELSMYGVDGTQVTLLERRMLDAMVCDYDYTGAAPAAEDIDGDGGPELVYTWSASREDSWRPDEQGHATIVIVDANDFREQFRFSRNVAQDENDGENVTGLTTVDEDGDGLFDLRTSFLTTSGYCTGYGWALDSRFVLPEDATEEDPTCRIEIEQTTHTYDAARDSWMPDEGSPKS